MGGGDLVSEPKGMIRLASAIVCICAVFMAAFGDGMYLGNSGGFVLYWGMIVCCAVSWVLIVCIVAGFENDIVTNLDKVFHFLAACMITVTGIMFLVHVNATKRSGGYAIRAAYGSFAIIYAILISVLDYMLVTGG